MVAVTLNRIGLDREEAFQTAKKLNKLLANYQVFYTNVRGLHWNIRGLEFFMLHGKFEELYTNASEKIDAIAERILALGFTPKHSMSTFLEASEIKEVENVSNAQKAIRTVLDNLKALLIIEREILAFTGEMEDEGTNALMSEHISANEELVWMYSAALG